MRDRGLDGLPSEDDCTPGEEFARSICVLMRDAEWLVADTGVCMDVF